MKTGIYIIGNGSFANKVHLPSPPTFEDEIAGIFAFNEERLQLTAVAYGLNKEQVFVYGGFLKKNLEFMNSVIRRMKKTSSAFRDVLKTMSLCESIPAQSLSS